MTVADPAEQTLPAFDRVVRRQRMVRPPYADRPVPRELIEQLLVDSQKSPSAGFTQGVSFVVLEDQQTELFWRLVAPGSGLTRTPAIVLPMENAEAYLARYREPDKAASGLGEDRSRWPVPFWTVDAAFATMTLLLSATARGVGAWFLGIFEGEDELRAALGIPEGVRPIGAVVLGYPSAEENRSPSLARGRRALVDVAHFGHW